MKTKSQKSSNTKRISNNFSNNLYNNFLRLEFLIVSNKFPNWTQVESTKKISKEFDHRHFFMGILCHNIFFLEFEQGKHPRNFDRGNVWWIINNINCGIDVNIKSTCCRLHKLKKYNMLEGCW